MQIRCPSCSKMLQVNDQLAGKQVKCSCGAVLKVPAPSSSAKPAAPAAAPRAPAPRAAAAAAAPAMSRQAPAPRAENNLAGLNAKEMDSLFSELTPSDMIVKGPSTEIKKVKTKDPLAAYGGASIPQSSGKAKSTAVVDGRSLAIASQNQRFLGNLVDSIFIVVGNLAIGFFGGIAVATIAGPDAIQANMLYIQVVAYVFMFVYFAGPEAIAGRTIGKLVMGTRVVSESGHKASIGQVIGRTLARFIPFDAVSYLFGRNPIGWHDKLSGTRVISLK